MSKQLRGCSLRNKKWREESSPMEHFANLADAILVFACGLMLSLIISGEVRMDLEQVILDQGQELTEVTEAAETLEELIRSENSYEKMGVLFKDPVTGKMYMLTE